MNKNTNIFVLLAVVFIFIAGIGGLVTVAVEQSTHSNEELLVQCHMEIDTTTRYLYILNDEKEKILEFTVRGRLTINECHYRNSLNNNHDFVSCKNNEYSINPIIYF